MDDVYTNTNQRESEREKFRYLSLLGQHVYDCFVSLKAILLSFSRLDSNPFEILLIHAHHQLDQHRTCCQRKREEEEEEELFILRGEMNKSDTEEDRRPDHSPSFRFDAELQSLFDQCVDLHYCHSSSSENDFESLDE